MYKIFHGFHLIEAYQDLKRKLNDCKKNQTVARCIKLTIAITLSLIFLWFLPIDTSGIEGLTVIEQKTNFHFHFSPHLCGFSKLSLHGLLPY